MYKEIAWNNFYNTGDINSYLEYIKLKNIGYVDNNIFENNTQKIMQNLEVMMNEVDKIKGDSY
jgi:hypothetical protein